MFCMKPKMKTVPEGNWYCKRCVATLGLKNEDDSKNKKPQPRKRKFIVDDENSDASSVTSDTKTSKNRYGVSGAERSKKRLQSNEIEEALQEDDEDQDEELEDDEVTVENIDDMEEAYMQSNYDEYNDNGKEQTTESNNQSDDEE